MRSGKFFLIPFFLLFSFLIFEKVEAVSCTTTVTTTVQSLAQYRCTLGYSSGTCGGEIQFLKRIASRKCQRECEICDGEITSCGDWSCSSWSYGAQTTVKNYDTTQTPWLVCTYNYGRLKNDYGNPDFYLTHEKSSLSLNSNLLNRGKIFCMEGEENCPDVDVVDWLPVLWNEMSYREAQQVISKYSNRFFEVSQLTCWGKCLEPVENPHYFGGSINPKREIIPGKIENEEQDPSEVRLPAKFGWEFEKDKWGANEWEEAIERSKEKCRNYKEGRGEARDERYCNQPPDVEISREILGKENFKIDVDQRSIYRDLGVGSFYFKISNLIKRFLPLAEGKKIQNWQIPGPDENLREVGDERVEFREWQNPAPSGTNIEWTRKEMYDYFDYYFLTDTHYSENKFRFGFEGFLKRGNRNLYLYVYSPSQDSKEKYLWIEYQDPNENYLTKEIRFQKNQPTYGPCTITPFTNHSLEVYPCCGADPENCLPPDIKRMKGEGWSFYALGPEIKSILGIRLKEVTELYPLFHLGTFNKLEGKIYRFIDIDWDRVWPSKLKRELSPESQKYNYFYVGVVAFDQFDNGLNDCEKECKKKCDETCLNICEDECEPECKAVFDKDLEECREKAEKKEEKFDDCKKRAEGKFEECKKKCHERFDYVRKVKCPTCKGEEKDMGCIVCKKCLEKYECTEKCITDCYERKKEARDCDEICGENPEIDLIAARGECGKINDEEKRKICNICANCKYKADYVDIEWCDNVSGTTTLSFFYKAREEKKFPIKDFYEKRSTSTEECERVDAPCPCRCERKFCECYKYTKDGVEILEHDGCEVKIEDKFLPYKTLRELEVVETTTKFSCATSTPYETGICYGMETLQSHDEFKDSKLNKTWRQFIEKLKVTRDIYAEFGNFGQKSTYSIPISLDTETPWNPQPWWEQDKFYPQFASFVANSVIVGIEGKNSGLRWDFKIKTFPKTQLCNYGVQQCLDELERKCEEEKMGCSKLKNDYALFQQCLEEIRIKCEREKGKCYKYDKDDCIGEKEDQYPFCQKIGYRIIQGFLPPEKQWDKEEKEFGIYRSESIQVPPVDRIFSFRLKIKSGNSFLDYLPKIPTQSPVRNFSVWEIWKSLPPLRDAIGRLKKEFDFLIYPCGDENGFFCFRKYENGSSKIYGFLLKSRITGKPPSFPFEEETSGPPPPKKIRIPHYFNWDASLGAASYWLKIEEKEVFHPDLLEVKTLKSNKWIDWLKEDTPYYWQVKTCADLCQKKDENFLQCGEWSEKIGPFIGYYLDPPSEMLSGIQFLPDEEITLWWKPIAKGTDCTHLKITYKGGIFEKRKDCIEKAMSTPEGYILLDQILKGNVDGKFVIQKDLFPTSTEIYEDKTTGVRTNICLGNYYYQLRYCTGEDCYKKKEECKKPEECKKEGGNYLDCVDCYYSAECKEAGPWSYLSSFEIVTRKYGMGGGGGFGTCKNIIPCTKCNFSDIPKIISNIISCVLWTLSPIAMVLLLLYTGIRIYFSFGSPEAIESAKSIWKAVGIGWLIMLFSWLIVNLIGKAFKMPGW